MLRALIATAACAGTAGTAFAGGIDRAGQRVDILYKDGNYAEASVAYTTPDVTGVDVPSPLPSRYRYDNVADDFTSYGFGIKFDVNDRLTIALTGAEDFGSDIVYSGNPATSMLGSTSAIADTYSTTLMARYKLTDNFSLHGGVRRDVADGTITLGGLAYGRVNGYKVRLSEDDGYGYLIGGAYEIPDIAFRLGVTYNSKIRHDFKTTETLSGASLGKSDRTSVDTPQSVNIDFQTGIAPDTLLFANIRWAEWSEFKIEPEKFNSVTGTGLVTLEDSTTYTIGIARRFNERFAASASFLYEPEQSDDLVSPLAPTNGFTALAVGASYRVENIEFSGGVRYTWIGDARPETGTPDTARASFTGNDAVSIGFKIGYYF
ncbi:MAG: outer membrane protein transport protein [Rhodobacteraceae bacterium]|nr:outer membrane protein transport protein [Paracoccaceae bacterium]